MRCIIWRSGSKGIPTDENRQCIGCYIVQMSALEKNNQNTFDLWGLLYHLYGYLIFALSS
jgi:hypothetical protein